MATKCFSLLALFLSVFGVVTANYFIETKVELPTCHTYDELCEQNGEPRCCNADMYECRAKQDKKYYQETFGKYNGHCLLKYTPDPEPSTGPCCHTAGEVCRDVTCCENLKCELKYDVVDKGEIRICAPAK